MNQRQRDAAWAVPNDNGAALPFLIACAIHFLVGLVAGVGIVQLIRQGASGGQLGYLLLFGFIAWGAYRGLWAVADAISLDGGFLRGDGVGDRLRSGCYRFAVCLPLTFHLIDYAAYRLAGMSLL